MWLTNYILKFYWICKIKCNKNKTNQNDMNILNIKIVLMLTSISLNDKISLTSSKFSFSTAICKIVLWKNEIKYHKKYFD